MGFCAHDSEPLASINDGGGDQPTR